METAKQCNDLVDLSYFLIDQLSELYLSNRNSDVIFVIDDEKIFAHKFILMLRCEYFRLMFSSGLKEALENEIELKETPTTAFKDILKYVYTGKIFLTDKTIDDIIELICLGHRYELHHLVEHLIKYIEANINIENVCSLYATANLYGFNTLQQHCFEFILNNGFEVLQQDDFYYFDANTLTTFFSSDDFCAEEIEVFKAIVKWMKLNPECERDDITNLLWTVRLSLINEDDLIAFVWPTGLFDKNELLNVIQRNDVEDLILPNYRRCVSPISNINEILNGITEKSMIYQRPYQWTESIIFSIPGSVTIELSNLRFINYIEMLLGNCDKTGYSYYIEVANNRGQWNRIADFTDYYCHSSQTIYFPKCPVKAIRISGTRCKGDGLNFIIDAFQCKLQSPPSSLLQTRNRNEINYSVENKNKFFAPLYTRAGISCKPKNASRFVF